MRIQTLGILAAAVGGIFAMGSVAQAAVFTDVTLGQAGSGGFNFVAFQTGANSFSASNSGTLFDGNVGLASGGSTNFSGGGTITGTLFKDPGATVQANVASQMNINGGITVQSLAQAVSDVKLANTTAASLAANAGNTFASIGSSAATFTDVNGTANAFGGKNSVFSVTGNINITNPSKDLTISGGLNDFFIINVGGDVTVSNGAILLSGGITPDHVLFNFTGATGSVNLSNASSTLHGIFLAPQSSQSIHLTPRTVNGVIIGDTIHTSSGPNVNLPPGGGFGVPEPASLGVLGLGVIGLLMRRRRA